MCCRLCGMASGGYVRVYFNELRMQALRNWKRKSEKEGDNAAYNALIVKAVENELLERGFLIEVQRKGIGNHPDRTAIVIGRDEGGTL